jgi:hypothetical protein
MATPLVFAVATALAVLAPGAVQDEPGNPPSTQHSQYRGRCIQSIAATAGHDLYGRNAIAGRPYQPESPGCNTYVDQFGRVVDRFGRIISRPTARATDAAAVARAGPADRAPAATDVARPQSDRNNPDRIVAD